MTAIAHRSSPSGTSISCIIPVHNGERFLAEALDSVLTQSHPVDEVIVVDDGSVDDTAGIFAAVVGQAGGKCATQLRYLQQDHRGPAAARNMGIEAATGELIAFLDADDLWRVDKTARQLARFAAHPAPDIVAAHIQNFWMDEVRAEAERMRDHPRARPMAGYCFSTVMARRTVFTQYGLLDTSLHHADDTEWFMRLQDANAVVEMLPDVLVQRRMHLHNFSRQQAQASRSEYLRLLQRRTHKNTPAPSPDPSRDQAG